MGNDCQGSGGRQWDQRVRTDRKGSFMSAESWWFTLSHTHLVFWKRGVAFSLSFGRCAQRPINNWKALHSGVRCTWSKSGVMDFRWQGIGNVAIPVSLLCAAGLSGSILHRCCPLHFSPFLPFCCFPVKHFYLNWQPCLCWFWRPYLSPLWLTDTLPDRKDLDPDSPFEWFGLHESDKWLKNRPFSHLF